MIDCKIDRHHLARLECCGRNVTLAAEICKITNLIYSAVMKSDPRAAQLIRMTTMLGMAPDSPTWDADENVEGIFITQEGSK